MSVVNQRRFRAGLIGPALAAILVLVVVFAPAVLLGEGLSAASLIVSSLGVLAAGFLMRAAGGFWRPAGTTLVVVGTLAVAITGGFVVLLLAGWGRGY